MTPVELRRFVFLTPEQWRHGFGFRLRSLEGGGYQLFSTPSFHGWVTQVDEARVVSSLDIDVCGRLIWLHRHDGHLYRRDPSSGMVERLIPLAVSGGATAGLGRTLHANGRLWIHDRGNSRVLALRADTFQILAEIPLPSGIDVALAGRWLFAIDATSIRTFDSETGQPLGGFPISPATSPVVLGADPDGRWLYVVDACTRGFLRFAVDGRFAGEVGRFDDIAPSFTPRFLCLDADGNLLVSDGSGSVHEFAADGGYIGHTGMMGPITAILALTCGADGHLYVADEAGIARFGRDGGVAGNAGFFYSATLDNGTDGRTAWHRLDVVADLADGGAVDVYYATSNEPTLADRITAILTEHIGAAEQAAALEKVLGDHWRGPRQLRALTEAAASDGSTSDALVTHPTHSLLFDQGSGRYLWLKIALSGLGPRATAAVRELRVYYPRLSYLRYLPAMYQEDKPSREFLERFLSLFETVFSGLEAAIERVPDLFDPERTPKEFLDWLAQWLDIAVEEDWPADVKRRLIGNASHLHQRKGTPCGLADFIEIVTGRRPLIRESFATERPSVLGADLRLGADSRLRAPPVEGRPPNQQTHLGRASILGTSQIRADATMSLNAFRASAHAFTVVLNLPPQQFRRHARGLHRVIREHSPAHAAYDIHVASGAGLGPDAVVGVSAQVVDPQPLHLGYSVLGRLICLRKSSYGPELGVDATLLGQTDGSTNASAVCCGE